MKQKYFRKALVSDIPSLKEGDKVYNFFTNDVGETICHTYSFLRLDKVFNSPHFHIRMAFLVEGSKLPISEVVYITEKTIGNMHMQCSKAEKELQELLETLVPLTREKVDTLKMGQELYYPVRDKANKVVKIEKWRVNGKLKTWKKDKERFELPVKHGLRTFDTVDQNSMLHLLY